jgi:hypothetical protein
LTDFIVLMPLKLKELRNRADETARTMQVYTHVRHAEYFWFKIKKSILNV